MGTVVRNNLRTAPVHDAIAVRPSAVSLDALIYLVLSVTIIAKIASEDVIVRSATDLVFVLCGLFVFPVANTMLFLVASAVAIPNIPGIDKLFGLISYVEYLVIVLAVRSVLSGRFSLYVILESRFLCSIFLIFFVLLMHSLTFAFYILSHALVVRFFVIFVLCYCCAWGALDDPSLLPERLERLLFGALRIAVLVYLTVFVFQFVFPDAYEEIFVASDGLREGYRIAYQIHTYIPVMLLAILYILAQDGVIRQGLLRTTAMSHLWLWLAACMLALAGTGSRLVWLHFFALYALFVLVRFSRAVVFGMLVLVMGAVLMRLSVFEFAIDRVQSISTSDDIITNMQMRMEPGLGALEMMNTREVLFGKGFSYQFFVPWFNTRASDYDAYASFIDQLWLTVFVQSGVVGVLCVILVFGYGTFFWIARNRTLGMMPFTYFLILFYLSLVHGFANLAYSKDCYVVLGIVAGSFAALKRGQPPRGSLALRGVPSRGPGV
ncbi:MAG TPA: DUF6369 family protein [Defluviicoccus sp.]|nr:DUF6369 family protein [Defluviicoccus sp.]